MSDNVFAPPRANVETQEGPEVLWDMTFKEVRKLYHASINVGALGVLYALGAVGVLVASISFVNVPLTSPSGAAVPGAFIVAVLVVFGLLYIAAAVASFMRPRWGRWLGIVLCVLGLLSFPFGTLVGIIGLIAYARGGKLFGPDRLLHKDVKLVYKQRKHDKQ